MLLTECWDSIKKREGIKKEGCFMSWLGYVVGGPGYCCGLSDND